MSHLVLFNYEIFNLMLHCVCVCVCVRACCRSSPCTAGVQWLLICNQTVNERERINHGLKKIVTFEFTCSLHGEMSTNQLLYFIWMQITVLKLLVNKILIQI